MNFELLKNSLLLALWVTAGALLLGAVVAIVAASCHRPVRNLISGCALIVFALPPFLVTNTWLHYFGLAGTWRQFIDFNLYSFSGTAVLMVLLFWPVGYGFALAGLLRIPRELLEWDPLIRGATILRSVLLPLAKSHLLAAFVVLFVLALNHFSVPALLQTKVYPEEVWVRFNTSFDYRQTLAVAWPLILSPALLLLLFRLRPAGLVFRRSQWDHETFRARLGGPILTASGVVTGLVVFVSLLLPIWQLISANRTWVEFIPAFKAGSTALATSAFIAASSALLLLLLARICAGSRAFVLGWIFFLVPGILLAMALIYLFNRAPFTAFYQSFGILFLAYALKFFGPAWTGISQALKWCDPALRDFGRLHGANWLQRVRYIELPQIGIQLAALFYFLFLLVLWDVETLVLLVPPGSETISLRIFNMLHYGHASQVNALCIWLLLLALAPMFLLPLLTKLSRSVLLVPLAVGLFLTGCSSNEQASPSRSMLVSESKLQSEFFGSVQVFGTRGNGPGQFNKPRSVGIDNQDNFYVVDLTGRVQKFSSTGDFLFSWAMPQTDKGKPKGMSLDPEGRLILLEPHYCRVNHFDAQGKLALQWGTHGTNAGELMFPRAVAVNSSGDVYLSEYGLVERVQRYSAGGTNFLGSFGKPGTAPAEFNRPEGLGIDPHDRLFVADSCNHRIQIFSPEGKFLEQFGRPGRGKGEISFPYDVRIDALGYRFVCEFGNSRVQVFDRNNQSVEVIGSSGAEPGRFNNPWAIALDSRGNLYVADGQNHRVQKFLRKGNYPAQFTKAPGPTIALQK